MSTLKQLQVEREAISREINDFANEIGSADLDSLIAALDEIDNAIDAAEKMILLNFAHPMTDEQKRQIEALTGQPLEQVIDINSQIDLQQPLMPQVVRMADQAGLSPTEWQTLSLQVNPPSLASSAVVLLAEIAGRCGFLPRTVRMRPVQGALPPRYEVAEIIDLRVVQHGRRGPCYNHIS